MQWQTWGICKGFAPPLLQVALQWLTCFLLRKAQHVGQKRGLRPNLSPMQAGNIGFSAGTCGKEPICSQGNLCSLPAPPAPAQGREMINILSTDEGNSFTATERRTWRPTADKFLVWLSTYKKSKETMKAENKITKIHCLVETLSLRSTVARPSLLSYFLVLK